MDLQYSKTGAKLIGIGEAVVLEVRTLANQPAHQVRISHPDIGDTGFIPYCQTAGMYRTPRVGDLCYVFCNENFHQYPVAWGHRISEALAKILVGAGSDSTTIIYSSGNDHRSVKHKIELDDGTNNGIRVTTSGGNKLSLNDSGDVTLSQVGGATINLSNDKITLFVAGSSISIGSDGIKITSAGGSTLKVDKTILGTASDTFSTFDGVVVSTHTHTGNIGYPTSPPMKTGA